MYKVYCSEVLKYSKAGFIFLGVGGGVVMFHHHFQFNSKCVY